MPNQVFGPYNGITCINGSTPANATWGNLIQTQASIALHGFNPKLIGSGFVYSGVVCTKDASVANQLDIASGVAYVVLSDGTVGEIDVGSGQTQTTSGASVTWHLYLQPDGTWYWSTSNAPAANSLHICDVTTDGSGNIVTVTDQRVTSVAMGSGAALVPTIGGENVAASVTPSQAGVPAASGVTFGGAALVSGDNAAKSATFDGTAGYIPIPAAGLPTGAGAWTLEAWVRPTNGTNATNGVLWSLGDGGTTGHEVSLAQAAAGGWAVAGWGSSPVSGGTSAAGVAHHVAATYDGTSLRLYVDGALVAGPTAQALSLTGTHAVLGAAWSGSAWIDFLAAAMAEGAVYGTALSAARISAHYAAGTAGGYAATIAADSPLRYYRLNEAVGATYANSSIASTLAVSGSDGSHNLGRVASVGGQATVGKLGATGIVAQALDVHVTATTLQTILTYTAPADGLYRLNGHAQIGNSGVVSISFGVTYTEPHSGNTDTPSFASPSHVDSGGGPALINGISQTPGSTLATDAMVIRAKAGTAITVTYQAGSGTVNDYVTVVVERLA